MMCVVVWLVSLPSSVADAFVIVLHELRAVVADLRQVTTVSLLSVITWRWRHCHHVMITMLSGCEMNLFYLGSPNPLVYLIPPGGGWHRPLARNYVLSFKYNQNRHFRLYSSKQRSRSFILVPIEFSYTTSYRLSIVTFALVRTV